MVQTIYLAGGCFWGLQKYFDQFDGVLRTEVGYANGPDKAPSYEDVCHDSGHAETVKIEYDEDRISPEELLDKYFMVIAPASTTRTKDSLTRSGRYTPGRRQKPARSWPWPWKS